MPYWMRQLMARGLIVMDEAGDGSGGSGDGGNGAGSETTPEPTKPESKPSDEDQGGKKADGKPTDAEAKLLQEVMDKKKKLKALEEAQKELQQRLASFEGIDPAAVKKMMEEQRAAEQRKLEEQGNWEALKKQMNEQNSLILKQKEEEVAKAKQEAEALQAKIAELTVGNAFAQSQFIQREFIAPGKARKNYGDHVEFDGERVVVYDKPANAKSRTMLVDAQGESLAFDLAIQKLVELDPEGDQVVKSKARPGAGSRTGSHSSVPATTRELSAKEKIAAGLKSFGVKK